MLNSVSAIEDLLFHMVNEKIIKCKLCPRLTKYIHEVGKTKTKTHVDEVYWAKPSQLLVVLKLNYWLLG